MLPHPTTMSFAWEEEVLRASRIFVCVFVLTVIALISGSGLISRAHVATPEATAGGPVIVTTISVPALHDGDVAR